MVCCSQILEVSGKFLKTLEQIRRLKLNNVCLEDNCVNKACKIYCFEGKKASKPNFFCFIFMWYVL